MSYKVGSLLDEPTERKMKQVGGKNQEATSGICTTWMDLQTVMLSEVVRPTDKHHVMSLLCGNELIYKTEMEP